MGSSGKPSVLILVLVEHTLGARLFNKAELCGYVLILVLVEHTLGGQGHQVHKVEGVCLNPCFSGTYSRSQGELWLRMENSLS